MSLLNTEVLPKLEGHYEVTVKSYKEISNKQGGYVSIVLQFPDREYNFCLFPKRVDYLASCLRNQFGITEKVTLKELLDRAKTEAVNIWIDWSEEYNSYNIAFHESVE
jgi:hypothetical protein